MKDHVGPCGKRKCLVSLLNGLGDRVSELETRLLESEQRHREELQTMRELHEKRVHTLLATVSSLEERLDRCEVDFSTAASRSDGGLVEVSASQQLPECCSLRATVSRLEERLDRYEADLVGVRETQSTPMSSSDGSVETNASRQWSACDETDSLAASAGDQSTVGPIVSSACSSAATEVADSVAGVKHDGHVENSSRLEPRKAQSHAGTSSSSRHRQVRNDGVGLVGATKLSCALFHVRGISLQSTEEDILLHCRAKGITVTGAYMLRTKIWGAQSAKLFVAAADREAVLAEHF